MYLQCDAYLTHSTNALKTLLSLNKGGAPAPPPHLLRYLAKVSLQHCAVKSELEQHREAERLARESFEAGYAAVKGSFERCKEEVEQQE